MINSDSLVYSILSGQTKEQYLGLILFGFLGLIASVLVELIRHKSNIKITGGFNLGYWFTDNFARLLLSILIVFVGVLYTQDLVGIEIGNKGALVMGFCTDKIIETIVSLKLTNVLGSLIKPKK